MLHAEADAEVAVFVEDEVFYQSVQSIRERGIQRKIAGLTFALRVLGEDAEDFDLTQTLGNREVRTSFRDTLRGKSTWYYARGIQANGEVVWSSPVFVTRSKP